MVQPTRNVSSSKVGEESNFDFSTPEGIEALEFASSLVLELREEVNHQLRLYERTLGLAVLPMLILRLAKRTRRAMIYGRGRSQ